MCHSCPAVVHRADGSRGCREGEELCVVGGRGNKAERKYSEKGEAHPLGATRP